VVVNKYAKYVQQQPAPQPAEQAPAKPNKYAKYLQPVPSSDAVPRADVDAAIEEAAAAIPGGYEAFRAKPADPQRMAELGYVQDPLAKSGYAKGAPPKPTEPARPGWEWTLGSDPLSGERRWVQSGATPADTSPNMLNDIGMGLAAPFQQNENLRTIAGAPLQLGQGLGQGVQAFGNNIAALGTDAINSGMNLADPSRQQFDRPRVDIFDKNVLLDEGGLLSSEAGIIPRAVGQFASVRMPLGKASPYGGFGHQAAKDAAAFALSTDYRAPRLSDFISKDTPVIGPVADLLRSNENDPAIVSMMKNLGEDLTVSAVTAGLLKLIDGGYNLARPGAQAGKGQDPRLDPALAAQIRRVLANEPAAPAGAMPAPTGPKPFSAPAEPAGGGIVRRNADRIAGGTVGAIVGGVGDAYAAPGDGGEGGGGPLNAGTGAAIGFFGPRAVASAASRGWRAAARPFRPAGMDERVAARAVRNALASGGIRTPEEAAAAFTARYGDKPASIADLTQEGVSTAAGLSRRAGSTGEAARARGEDLLTNRAGRLERDIADTTGASPATITGDVDRMVALARQQATPAYTALREQNPFGSFASSRLEQLRDLDILRPHLSAVDRYRETLAATEGRVVGDFEYWDLVKRSLDDAEQAAAARNQPVPYDLDSARQAIVREVDALVPDYAAARQLGGEAPRMQEAFRQGQGLLGGRYTAEDVTRLAQGITGQQLTALQAGVIRSMVAKTEGPRGAMAALMAPGARQKLAQVFGADAADAMQARFAADAAIVNNATRINPNVGSVTSQAQMGEGGFLPMAAEAIRAVRSPIEATLAAMSKGGSYSQAQRDLMGQMLLDGATPENLARIFGNRGGRRSGNVPPAPPAGGGPRPANALNPTPGPDAPVTGNNLRPQGPRPAPTEEAVLAAMAQVTKPAKGRPMVGPPTRDTIWDGPVPTKPQSLRGWIRSQGGINDRNYMTGDMKAVMGRANGMPGLINRESGTGLDELARKAYQEGFDVDPEDAGTLMRLLEEEFGGSPSYRIGAKEEWDAYQDTLRARRGDVPGQTSRSPAAIGSGLATGGIVGGATYAATGDEDLALKAGILSGIGGGVLGNRLAKAGKTAPTNASRVKRMMDMVKVGDKGVADVARTMPKADVIEVASRIAGQGLPGGRATVKTLDEAIDIIDEASGFQSFASDVTRSDMGLRPYPELRTKMKSGAGEVVSFPAAGKTAPKAPAGRAAPASASKPAQAAALDLTPSGSPRSAAIGDARVKYFVENGVLTLQEINVPSFSSGKGQGSRAIDAIIAQADAEGLPIRLIPHAYGHRRLSDGDLKNLYLSRGFKEQTGDWMRREPGDSSASASKPPPVKSGFGSSKLPMDEGSRMARAREMGFDVDTPLYHGTGRDFDEAKGMFWGSKKPPLAEEYAAMRGSTGGRPAVIPFYARTKNTFDADDLPPTVTAGEFFNEVVAQAEKRGKRFSEAEKSELSDLIDRIRQGARTEESGPHYGRHDFWNDTVSLFGRDGKKAIDELFEKTEFDSIKMMEDGQETLGVFDPSNIRGKFATFDPSQSGSSKLLAGVRENATGLGVAGGAIAGGTLARDTDGDGVVSASERAAQALGGALSFGVAGGILGSRMGKAASGNALRRVDQAGAGGTPKGQTTPAEDLARARAFTQEPLTPESAYDFSVLLKDETDLRKVMEVLDIDLDPAILKLPRGRAMVERTRDEVLKRANALLREPAEIRKAMTEKSRGVTMNSFGGRPKPLPNALKGKPSGPSTASRMVAGGVVGGVAGSLGGDAQAQEDLTAEISKAESQISTVEQEIADLKKAKADFDKMTDLKEKQTLLNALGLYNGDIDGKFKGLTIKAIETWDARNAAALKKAEDDLAAGKSTLSEMRKRDAQRQMQEEQNPFADALREFGPTGAAVLGGVAAGVLRARGVGKSAKAVKVIENDINDLLTTGPVKSLMKKGGAANTERNRAVNMNQFYREGSAPDNKLPFNYGPDGYKPNPRAAKPGSLFPRKELEKRDGIGSTLVRPADVKIIGTGLVESALVTPFVADAERELEEAELDAKNNKDSIEALRRVERAKTNLAMYQALQRAGWGVAAGGALSMGYRYKLPKPDIRGAEEEVAAITEYLRTKAPPKPTRPANALRPAAPPPPPVAAPSNQLLLPLPPPPKKPKPKKP